MGSRSPWEGVIFGGKGRLLQQQHCRDLCKKGWTNRDAVWVMDSGGLKRVLDGTQIPHAKGAITGGHDMPYDTLPWAIHKWLHRSISRLSCGLGWAKGSTSSIVFAIAFHEGTLAPPDEYDCTDRVRRRCGLMSNYFDHLLLLRYGGGKMYRDECVCMSVCSLVSITSRSNFTVSSALVAQRRGFVLIRR